MTTEDKKEFTGGIFAGLQKCKHCDGTGIEQVFVARREKTMQRRDFLKIGAVGAVTVAVQGVTLAEPNMHGDNIWKETPETVEELDQCIRKYTNFLFDSSKAWEQLHVQTSDGKWHIQNAVHIEYALGTGDVISESGKTPEQRLVRHMWATARQLILNSKDETPHLIWRRRPMIEDFNHDTLGAMKKIRMRMWLSGEPYRTILED